MKKSSAYLAIFSVVLFIGVFIGCTNNRPTELTVDDLPEQAQAFISDNFPSTTTALVEYNGETDGQEYTVTLKNDFIVTFNRQGEWTEVEAPDGMTLPSQIVPDSIAGYIEFNYPNIGINEIEKSLTGYNTRLLNGVELMFSNSGKFLGTYQSDSE